MRSNEKHMEQLRELGVETIDVVAVNLYPFKQTIMKEGVTLAEAIENIDIGGPTMLRAASKNWQDVTVVVDSADYPRVIAEMKEGGVSQKTKFALATKVFETTAAYDSLIAAYLREQDVYKRQVLIFGPWYSILKIQGKGILWRRQYETGLHCHFGSGQREQFGFGAGNPRAGRIPVSYTHLDVYKRQVWENANCA